MKRLLFLTVLFTLTFFQKTDLQAQMVAQPIAWSTKIVALENNTFEIQIIGTIDEDRSEWHIYDLGPYVDGPTPTTLTFDIAKGAELVGKPYMLTKSKKKFDEMFGMEIGICEERAVFAQKVKVTSADSVSFLAIIEWQACDDQSCLPPTEKEFKIALPGAGKSAVTAPATQPKTPAAPKTEVKAETKPVVTEAVPAVAETVPVVVDTTQTKEEIVASPSDELVSAPVEEPAQKSIWGVIIEAIIWGFVALLTPCVFPMVPMTVSFFLKNSQDSNEDGAKKRSSKGKIMASFFGASIILLYTLPIAAIILITYFAGGEAVTADIFNWLATHWVPNVIFFLIFMVFAASFFGAFEIVLPSWLVNKTDSKSDKGGYIGVLFMALTLVLVSFSCTGPIVGTILIKSTQGEIWEPIITMFAFSAAFALPFTVFAFAPSLLKDLPKSGGWLNSVKVVLGFIEVALGLKFLSVADQSYHWGLLDREVYLAIWIVTFTLMGFYLLGKLRFAHDTPEQHISVKRLTLAIITFSFVVYMIPGMWGAPLKALSGYMPPMATQDFKVAQFDDLKTISVSAGSSESNTAQNDFGFKPKYSDFLKLPHNLPGFFSYNEAVEYAKKVGKPLFVDFTGHSCVNCREMEERVWSDPRALKLLREEYVVLALYADDKKEADEKDWVTTESGRVLKGIGKINSHLAMTKFNVNAQPYYAIIDPATEEHLVKSRGYNLDVDLFIKFLEEGVANYKN
ncbi:MAG: cytochrome c biogenesis protein CcdA [Bacteroidales bacterium]